MFENKNVAQLDPYVYGEQPTPSSKLIKLNTNENPYPPHSSVEQFLKKFDTAKLRLYPDPLCSELRKEVSKTYRLPGSYFLFGNGSDEIISLIFRTFFGRQDEVVFTQYTYSAYRTYAEALGVSSRTLPMGEDFLINLDHLDRISAKVFFLTNPNAPTGLAIKTGELEKTIKKNSSRLFVIDEAYADFAEENALSLVSSGYKNVLILRTLSKAYSLCGVRLGMAIGHPDLISAMGKIKDPYNVNALTQGIATTVFKHLPYYQKNIKLIKQERAHFAGQLTLSGFKVLPSQTNFLLVAYPGKNLKELYLYLVKKKIYVRHFDKPVLTDYLRISIGTPDEMKRVLAEMNSWVRK
jgi:histidinol-phosphate aminotransferase